MEVIGIICFVIAIPIANVLQKLFMKIIGANLMFFSLKGKIILIVFVGMFLFWFVNGIAGV